MKQTHDSAARDKNRTLDKTTKENPTPVAVPRARKSLAVRTGIKAGLGKGPTPGGPNPGT